MEKEQIELPLERGCDCGNCRAMEWRLNGEIGSAELLERYCVYCNPELKGKRKNEDNGQ